jgi:hypothetical protein
MASDAAELDAAAPALHSPRTVGARLFETLLNQRFSTGLVIGIALLLGATSLALDVTADDHFHALSLRSHPGLGGVARAPWDLFAFAKDPATNHALMEEGAFPWWTDPKLVIAFLRPLSSLSLWLDYALWPASPLCMHLHSLAWFAGLLAAVAALLRALAPSRGVANLALLIYGIDDARSMPVAWIAHRNALVALTPALLALYAHHRFRASSMP